MQGQASLLSQAFDNGVQEHACPEAGPLLHIHVRASGSSEPGKHEGDPRDAQTMGPHSAAEVRSHPRPYVLVIMIQQ